MKIKLAVCAALAITACVGLATGARADTIYNYVFSAGAGYSNGSGDSASLSGTFSWDATTNSVSASGIDLSGFDATGSGFGPVACSGCSTGIDGPNGQYFAINLGPQALYTIFANGLSNGADDPLALVWSGGNQAEYQGGQPFTSVSGSANLVPEPASMTLLGSALLGFWVIRRRRNRA
jgi:hypothetical protein